MSRWPLLAVLALASCSAPNAEEPSTDSPYLYLWTGASDGAEPDFLAVLDVAPDSARYGALVTTVPVPGRANGPHHTEHALADDRILLANGFATGQTFAFDLTDPVAPQVVAQIGQLGGFSHPHTFERLPDGHVLATFQMAHTADGTSPGGLVEMTALGEVVRTASAAGRDVPPGIRPYSALPIPALDRIVSTTTDMGPENPHLAREIQVWRLSDLELLHTFELPPGPNGTEADFSAEPRLLADGRTVLVSTFSCGLYLLDGLEGDAPSARLVASFPKDEDTWCAIPVVTGDHYLVTVPSIPGVVSLDVSDPARPREVGRVTLGPGDVPHWISLEPNGKRVVLTGYGELLNRVLILTFDAATGALAVDQRFREPGADRPGFGFGARAWPHGAAGAGVPHGAVFSRY